MPSVAQGRLRASREQFFNTLQEIGAQLMNTPLDSMALWRATLARQADEFEPSRDVLRNSFLSFRSRVADLVSTLGSELPNLTVHDITHLDALWRVANEIAGDGYPLNPAEAYVLGGAFCFMTRRMYSPPIPENWVIYKEQCIGRILSRNEVGALIQKQEVRKK
jgi:hypothetical protein